MKLYKHQENALTETEGFNKVAYYHDMGLGKTFTGSEKMCELGKSANLIICQKSKINDWVEHFKTYYNAIVYNMTNKKEYDNFFKHADLFGPRVAVINYDLVFRRPELKNLENFTLMLDESSLIQNEKAKRSKFIMRLNFENLILLSGTPTGGKYERLWSQLFMLGYNVSKTTFMNLYVNYHYDDINGFPVLKIDGYKNVERLKRKMHDYGCHFLKTDEVFDLPEQNHQTIKMSTSKEYRKFRKDCICTVDGEELIGDTTLTKMLRERQLCGMYSDDKLQAFRDLVESTNDRLIVFYNFTGELNAMLEIIETPYSIVNGNVKNLTNYEDFDNSITFVQYQAGAMGLNLQKANKIVYFTPPLSSELFEQSKKRIHRIGQTKPCFYYYLTCKNSIEERIYRTLEMRQDYTEKLFERGD